MQKNDDVSTQGTDVAAPVEKATPDSSVHQLSEEELQRIAGGSTRSREDAAKRADIG